MSLFPLTMRRFALLLAIVLAAFALGKRAAPNGDFLEYAAMTVALANHATPDITASDVAEAKRLAPGFADDYVRMAAGMRAGAETPQPGFNRGRDGGYFAIHFFTYPALAALPFRALQAAGADPLKCFQVVNAAFVFMLGLVLFRFFGSAARAGTALLLFMLCGGVLYWHWSSPECMSAAALLAALILYPTGAPRAAGLLAGLAATQNPPIGLFFGFAPLLQVLLQQRAGVAWKTALRNALRAPSLQGMAIVLVLAPLPIMFNLWQFGVPSLIAKYSTSPDLITLNRLMSFFFDLNQGMLIGVPALLAVLLLWGWRGRGNAVVLAACSLFALALAAPALSAQNWNSGAAGMMRYAFWGAMPFLFVFLLRLRQTAVWPSSPMAALLLVQLVCMGMDKRYGHVDFSPLARAALAHAPALYNPDPEIFHERLAHGEIAFDVTGPVAYQYHGKPTKTMYLASAPGIEQRLCGRGMELAPGNRIVKADRNFRYINGAILCQPNSRPGAALATFGAATFTDTVRLEQGWSAPEFGGGVWDGAWSDGERSVLTLAVDPALGAHWIAIAGHYQAGNERTRMTINGVDMGWQRLDKTSMVALPPAASKAASLRIELQHEAPVRASAQDARRIAYFLEQVALH